MLRRRKKRDMMLKWIKLTHKAVDFEKGDIYRKTAI